MASYSSLAAFQGSCSGGYINSPSYSAQSTGGGGIPGVTFEGDGVSTEVVGGEVVITIPGGPVTFTGDLSGDNTAVVVEKVTGVPLDYTRGTWAGGGSFAKRIVAGQNIVQYQSARPSELVTPMYIGHFTPPANTISGFVTAQVCGSNVAITGNVGAFLTCTWVKDALNVWNVGVASELYNNQAGVLAGSTFSWQNPPGNTANIALYVTPASATITQWAANIVGVFSGVSG